MSARVGMVFVALASSVASAAWGQATAIDEVGWISGCWERSANGVVTVERWIPPAGGTMLGVSRTVRGGRTVQYEFLRLFEDGAHLVYEAHPSGQATNSFTATTWTDSTVTFSDPAHDFPQHMTYSRAGPDSLVARISGMRGGAERSVVFAFRRVRCETG